jgi:tRNA(Ile)-lysidine synthase
LQLIFAPPPPEGAGGLADFFAASMARLGPFGPAPVLAVGASGGADSTALVLLTREWAAARGGQVVALIVDHGLRPESKAEAAATLARLTAHGVPGQILTLAGLPAEARLQEAARTARHAALAAAARAAGSAFLLLGHHAADQAETVAMRAARGAFGLEGMAACTARDDVLILRPLLSFASAALRAFLRAQRMDWVEDPSNQDEKFERVRVRLAGAGRPPANPAPRVGAEREAASFLARHATLRPEGFAIIRAGNMPARALGALLRTVAGSTYAPDGARTAALAQHLAPASLGGAILARSEKYGGWIVAREPAACAPPAPARAGTIWDGRFRLAATYDGADIGALGAAAASLRKTIDAPSIVLRGLPCLITGSGKIPLSMSQAPFHPPAPACPHPFSA